MKLKTLKDIEIHRKSTLGKCFTEQVLKQEAIKHILKLLGEGIEIHNVRDTIGFNNRKEETINLVKAHQIEAKINWIRDFFNITEEDLK